jgi:hypothetical protein
LGADLVGVTSIERAQKWVYTNWLDLHPIKNTFPDGTVKMMTYDAMEAQKGNFISAGYGVSPLILELRQGLSLNLLSRWHGRWTMMQ